MERHNPLLDPRPDDPIDQIHDFARDLAYLSLLGSFRNGTIVSGDSLGQVNEVYRIKDPTVLEQVKQKWPTNRHPNPEFLASFGYLGRHGAGYLITEKAFTLLDEPSQPPSIFISYRRKESSAFALLIEARLQLKGVIGIFIDRDIPGGEPWEQHIRTQIENSSVFVALLGKTALDADSWVARELEWADQAKCRLIPIWHNGHNLNAQKKIKEIPAILHERQSYTLKEESALEYDTAIIWLLNTLGYRS